MWKSAAKVPALPDGATALDISFRRFGAVGAGVGDATGAQFCNDVKPARLDDGLPHGAVFSAQGAVLWYTHRVMKTESKMKSLKIAGAFAVGMFTLTTLAETLSFVGSCGRNPFDYRVGEEMTFTVTLVDRDALRPLFEKKKGRPDTVICESTR